MASKTSDEISTSQSNNLSEECQNFDCKRNQRCCGISHRNQQNQSRD